MGILIGVHTFGCKVNQADTRAVLESLACLGVERGSEDQDCDIFLVASCAVTNEAERQCRQAVRSLRKRFPDSFLAVVGCYGEILKRSGRDDVPADFIAGSKGRDLAALSAAIADRFGLPAQNQTVDNQANAVAGTGNTNNTNSRRAIKIQDGCRMGCTYCIIPSVRGEPFSKPFGEVLREVEGLVKAGCPEIVLTGIHLNSYHADGGSLIDLLEAIQSKTDARRVRLGSFEMHLITAENIARLRDLECLCDHFHVSAQSGSDRVLAAMNRHYTSGEYLERIGLLREAFPNALVTTDLIAGFPSEKERDHEDSMDLVRAAAFERVHVFPFSPKTGTPAASMSDPVPESVKKERVASLIALAREVSEMATGRFVGTTQEVLFEEPSRQLKTGWPGSGLVAWEGYARNYLRVAACFAEGTDVSDSLASVVCQSHFSGMMQGVTVGNR